MALWVHHSGWRQLVVQVGFVAEWWGVFQSTSVGAYEGGIPGIRDCVGVFLWHRALITSPLLILKTVVTVRLLKPVPPRQWKPIRRQNWNYRFQHFQIQSIKCPVQNNEIFQQKSCYLLASSWQKEACLILSLPQFWQRLFSVCQVFFQVTSKNGLSIFIGISVSF